MDDKTMLMLAAKAYWAGEIDDVVSIEWGDEDNAVLYTHADNQDHNGIDCTYAWNPLEDDGDALRLAVKLGILASPEFWHHIGLERLLGKDKHCVYASTRRAIVMTAADIGMEAKAPNDSQITP